MKPRQLELQRVAQWIFLLAAGALGCIERGEMPEREIETHSQSATVPSGFIDETLLSGLTKPTQMAFAPDGRLFLLEQTGTVRIYKNGQSGSSTFLQLATDPAGERGLLGIAFDPGFASNGFVYIYYTSTSGGTHNRVSRFTASGDSALAGSEFVLVDLERLSGATNHNGGGIVIGRDGKLYVAQGENADGANAQRLDNRLGKILRYNLDGSIPSDNPFFTRTSGANRAIWALGLRNPYSLAVQPGTGRIFINDVGEATFEEIDVGAAGANYGWPHAEGPLRNTASDTAPLYAFDHGGGACSIIGGSFYNPPTPQFGSAWVGHYFFADHCAGWIRRLDPSTGQAFNFASGINSPAYVLVGPDGALYYLARGFNGTLNRIRAASSQPPKIDVQPQSQTVAAGRPVTFSVAASGSPPLAFQWQRNGINIGGANSASYTINATTASDNGAQFRVFVSNGSGNTTSNPATLTVLNNRPPVARIDAPAAGFVYTAGQTVSYAGTGSDPEDGDLPASAFTWEIVFHHDDHNHIFIEPFSGRKSGTFTIPNRGETATNVWYRVHLAVRDSAGIVTRSFVDLRPRVANIVLASNPSGLQVTLDGRPLTTPAAVPSVAGMIRTIGAVSPQSVNGKTYSFTSWSDGGASSHAITAPSSNQTFTASFREEDSEPPPTGGGGLHAEYFDSHDFTNRRLERVDGTLDFNWGDGGPDAAIAPDTFSVRWTGTVTATASEPYTFYTQADDGIRLWVNNQLLIDNLVDQPTTERSATINLVAGQSYPIRVDYYENGGQAVARLLWSSFTTPRQVIPQARLTPGSAPPPPPPPATGGGLHAEYFDNPDLTVPRLTRTDATVDFTWGGGSPDPTVGPDTFSVRWTGTVTATTSSMHTFYTQADDGIRLWVGGQLLIDNWVDQPVTERAGSIFLSAGQPTAIRIEYFENGIDAVARLLWSSPSLGKQVVPRERLSPR